jgi:hypothetical protein
MPQRQEPGGQRVAGGTFKGGPEAPPEGPEPRVIRVRLSSRTELFHDWYRPQGFRYQHGFSTRSGNDGK